MTRLLILCIPLMLAACAAPKPEGAVAQGDDVVCDRETQVGSMLPKTRCRSATQRAADRAGVDEMAQAVKNHPGQSPMPTGGR